MIRRIDTAGDPALDPYRHVGDPAWLRTHDLFVAEGRLVVERLLDLPGYAVQSILVNRAAHEALAARLAAVAADVFVSGDLVLAAVTGFNFHRGCLALARRPAPLAAMRLLGSSRLLGIEGVGNPDNIGGLFRAAAAFGVDGVLLDPAAGDPLYRKAIRVSMGASLRLPFARLPDWPAGLRPFRDDGFTIVALTPRAGVPEVATMPAGRTLLLVGAEGPGLHDDTLERADVRLRIPTGDAVDSLNVVVAAAIALYEQRRG